MTASDPKQTQRNGGGMTAEDAWDYHRAKGCSLGRAKVLLSEMSRIHQGAME